PGWSLFFSWHATLVAQLCALSLMNNRRRAPGAIQAKRRMNLATVQPIIRRRLQPRQIQRQPAVGGPGYSQLSQARRTQSERGGVRRNLSTTQPERARSMWRGL